MAFTYFFRDLQTLELLVSHVVPFGAGRASLKIWDAGCAMGQEAYSLAILMCEKMGYFSFKNLRIDATDIDGSNLFGAIIDSGKYVDEELKRLPPDIFEKYFKADPCAAGYCKIIDTVRSRVYFQRHDLLSLKNVGEGYAAILCKNVLLHFQPDERCAVIRMYHDALLPGGFFATEQTQKLPVEVEGLFEQVVPNAQLFRKKA